MEFSTAHVAALGNAPNKMYHLLVKWLSKPKCGHINLMYSQLFTSYNVYIDLCCSSMDDLVRKITRVLNIARLCCSNLLVMVYGIHFKIWIVSFPIRGSCINITLRTIFLKDGKIYSQKEKKVISKYVAWS